MNDKPRLVRLPPKEDWVTLIYNFPPNTPIEVVEDAWGIPFERLEHRDDCFENREVSIFIRLPKSGRRVQIQFRGEFFCLWNSQQLYQRLNKLLEMHMRVHVSHISRFDIQQDFIGLEDTKAILPPSSDRCRWSFLSRSTKYVPSYLSYETGCEMVTGWSVRNARFRLSGYRSDIDKMRSPSALKRRYYRDLYQGNAVCRLELSLSGINACAMASVQLKAGCIALEDLLASFGKRHSIRVCPSAWAVTTDGSKWPRSKEFESIFFLDRAERRPWDQLMKGQNRSEVTFTLPLINYERSIKAAASAGVLTGRSADEVGQDVRNARKEAEQRYTDRVKRLEQTTSAIKKLQSEIAREGKDEVDDGLIAI